MRKILLVDDSLLVRTALGKRLIAAGVEVVMAGSAAEALMTDAKTFACAVLDVDLGDGNGLMVAEALVAKNGALRVAFFTSGDAPPPSTRFEAATFEKSKDLDRLVAWVVGGS
ncbi:MAG TPA: response regulator [Polyangiaceae bacterium]